MTGNLNLVIFIFSFSILFVVLPGGTAGVTPGVVVLFSVAMWNKNKTSINLHGHSVMDMN